MTPAAKARCWLLYAVLVSVPLGCGGAPSNSQRNKAPLPSASPVVLVTMHEYRFDYTPTIRSGQVVFRFVNEGQVPHRPALVPLPEDLPPIDQQLRGSKRRAVTPLAGVYDRRPGATGSFAVNLTAGRRYALICYAHDPDGSAHATKGMDSEFRPASPPQPGRGEQ